MPSNRSRDEPDGPPPDPADTLLAEFATDVADFEAALTAATGPDGSAPVEQRVTGLAQGYHVARRRRLRGQHPCTGS